MAGITIEILLAALVRVASQKALTEMEKRITENRRKQRPKWQWDRISQSPEPLSLLQFGGFRGGCGITC